MIEGTTRHGKMTMADMMVNEAIITKQQKDELLAEMDEEKGITFEKLLVDKGLASEEQVANAISLLLGVMFCDVKAAEFNPDFAKKINKDFAVKNCCIPYQYDPNHYVDLWVVTDNPLNCEVTDTLCQALGCTVIPLVGLRTAILKKIEELYGESVSSEAEEKAADTKAVNTDTEHIVRRATADDIPGILKLLVQVDMVHHNGRPDLFKGPATKYNETELAGIIANESTPVFVLADSQGKVKGHAFTVHKQVKDSAVITDVRTLYVDDICVDEACRRQGIGRLLYDAVRDYAKTQGFYNITLNVWNCNPSAMEFYESLGLVPQKVCMEEVL